MLVTTIAVLSSIFLGWQLTKLILPWLPSDIRYLRLASNMMKGYQRLLDNQITFPDMLMDHAKTKPDKKFFLYLDQVWTFNEMYEWMNRTVRALHDIGVRRGDQIGLMMHNEPAYIPIMLGSMRLGSEIALINYNLHAKALLHSLTITEVKILIVGGDDSLIKAVEDIKSELKNLDISVINYEKSLDGKDSLKSLIETQDSGDLEAKLSPKFPLTKTACYIFTSGTTGRSKAVKMSFAKLSLGCHISVFGSFCADDIIYCSLPFYHTAGCMAGILAALNSGIAIAARRHFSASNFISDCIKYDATLIQYIGETMRYICHQPERSSDRDHKIRLAYGNGMRADVWVTFLERFGHDIHVLEFYAATEGNASFVNLDGKVGAVGMCSPLTKKILKTSFLKYDWTHEELYRDASGRCVEVGFNEPGLVVGKISAESHHSEYKGAKELTNQKIIRDVFQEGDAYYNSGDLLMRDEQYYVRFCDRVGDTFRWKGENVSTNEVSDVIVQYPGISEANVYGVKIPGKDGRAGMAAIIPRDPNQFNREAFLSHCSNNLPKYAIPVFLRIRSDLEVTSTMKQFKVKLKIEGFNLDTINDVLYFLNPQTKSYVTFTREVLNSIEDGGIKL